MPDPVRRTPGPSPIAALPVELLQHIFTLITPDAQTLDFPTRQAPLNLLQVCPHWRHTALSVPALWTALELPLRSSRHARQGLLHLALARLAPFPSPDLHITLESAAFTRAPRKDRARLTTFLRARRADWRSLYLEQLDAESMAILFKGADADARGGTPLRPGMGMARLAELTLCGEAHPWPDARMSGLRQVLACAPGLRKLTLVHLAPPCALPLHALLPQLEALDLTRCVQADSVPLALLCASLSALATLRILCISTRLWVRRDVNVGDGHGVDLPELRTLVVRTACHEPRLVRLIELLRAPRLANLQLYAAPCTRRDVGGRTGPGYESSDADLQVFVALLLGQKEHPFPLHTLDMPDAHWRMSGVLMLLSPASPGFQGGGAGAGVRRLVLDAEGVRTLSAWEWAGREGAPRPSAAPELDELVVLDGWACVRSVLRFVQARAAAAAAADPARPVKRIRRVRLLPARGAGAGGHGHGHAQGTGANAGVREGRGRDVRAEEALMGLVEVYGSWEERPEGFLE